MMGMSLCQACYADGRSGRTRGDDDRFSDRNVPQRPPHVSLHLGINSSRELVYEHDRGIAWTDPCQWEKAECERDDEAHR